MVGINKIVLRAFADLAERIGFESPPISTLKQYPDLVNSIIRLERKPPLGTDGLGITKNRRCRLPTL